MADQVVLVDKNDHEFGVMDKIQAHRGTGILHRAVTVLLFRVQKSDRDREIEVLLQKRSDNKLLWPGVWADTVSSHNFPGEGYEECGARRLQEEMGIRLTPPELTLVFKLLYQARYNDEFSEHELDGIVVGWWDGEPTINPEEVSDYQWMRWGKLTKEITKPSHAPWLQKAVADRRLQRFIERRQDDRN